MKILLHLGHPAHLHLFNHTIKELSSKEHEILIAFKKKDILEDLLIESNYNYVNLLPAGRKDNILGILKGLFIQDYKLWLIAIKFRPDILIGTSSAISHIGKILNIPSIIINEDDARAISLFSFLTYPLATNILSPKSCNNKGWQYKTINYNGYHELAYLHPKYFKPNIEVVQRYINIKKPYFLLRFAKLSAYHDQGKIGINFQIASKIISLLKVYGNIYISSERELEPEFAQYRLNIDPIDMHHILAFAKIYIGDSQTMAAEAAVLGTPALRFNDFVGKLGYLEELELTYGLTYGIKTNKPNKLFIKIDDLLKMHNLKKEWHRKREIMLKDKIDVTAFMVWFIENYPKSAHLMKDNPEYQYNFK